jgi:hypothetical protein
VIGGWRTLRRRAMIVNLDTGRSFEGVLYSTSGSLLVLRNARALEPGQQAVPMDGELVVDRSRVEFLQLTKALTP